MIRRAAIAAARGAGLATVIAVGVYVALETREIVANVRAFRAFGVGP